jgi:hypothetical protein
MRQGCKGLSDAITHWNLNTLLLCYLLPTVCCVLLPFSHARTFFALRLQFVVGPWLQGKAEVTMATAAPDKEWDCPMQIARIQATTAH